MKQTNVKVVTIAMFVATFLTAIEGTIVSTAMPIIVSDLQGIELMNWVFSIYLLTSAVAVPIFGKLSDLFGRKLIFNIGTVIFLIGSTMCGFSQSMEGLIFFRALQGIGAGAIMPVTMTIVADIYPYEKRAQIMGIIGTAWGIAGVIGPLVGGFFVDQLSWHWIFLMNIPFGIVAMFMVGISLVEDIDKTKKSIDYFGALTFSIGMISLLLALQNGGETGNWFSGPVLLPAVIALLFIFAFYKIEQRVEDPLIPLQLLKNKTILFTNIAAFLVSVVLIGLMVYIPMWVQGLLGYGATVSGLMLAPMSLTWFFGSFIGGKLLLTKGDRFTIILGVSVLIIGIAGLLTFSITAPPALFYGISAIVGFGFGIVVTITTVSVQSTVEPKLRGTVTASNTFFRTLGQSIGVAFLGTYFNSKIAKEMALNNSFSNKTEQLNELLNPHTSGQMETSIRAMLREILYSGIHYVFITMFIVIIVALVIAILLPKRPSEIEVNS